MSPVHLIALIAPPAALRFASRRLAPGAALAFVVTSLVTWLIATAVLSWFVPDPSDIGALLGFYYIIVPCLCIPVAAIVATQLMPTRGRLVSAILLALFSWLVGIAIGMLIGVNHAAAGQFWDYALWLALPALYTACGAVLAAAEQSPS